MPEMIPVESELKDVGVLPVNEVRREVQGGKQVN